MDGGCCLFSICMRNRLEERVGDVAEAEVAAEFFKPDRQFSVSALRQLFPQERLPDEFRDRDIWKRTARKPRELPVHLCEQIGPPVVQNLQPGHLLWQCRETSQLGTVCLVSGAVCMLRALLRAQTFIMTVSRPIQMQDFKKTIGQCTVSVFQNGDAVVPDVENMCQATIRRRIRYGICVCIRVGHFLADVFDGIGVFKEDPPKFHTGQGQVDLLKIALLEKISWIFHADLRQAFLSKLRDDVAEVLPVQKWTSAVFAQGEIPVGSVLFDVGAKSVSERSFQRLVVVTGLLINVYFPADAAAVRAASADAVKLAVV